MTEEYKRLNAPKMSNSSWLHWGPYLSERQWGTVREDYSASQNAWNCITHDMARHYAYRWGADGIGGICDKKARICLSFAFWNGRDSILKERLFGLSNPEGNHGEDVKELYYYLDATPTHSYGKMLYKYPHAAFPYSELVAENGRRGREDREYEIEDTGIFDEDRYFDVVIEHAKAAPDDIYLKISATNKGPETVPLCVMPQAWFRNTWSHDNKDEFHGKLYELDANSAMLNHHEMEDMVFHCQSALELIYCDNETDRELLNWGKNKSKYPKNSFHSYIVERNNKAVNPKKEGTKVGAPHFLQLKSGETKTIYARLYSKSIRKACDPEALFEKRKAEADAFYEEVQKGTPEGDLRDVQRQALAGLLMSKQYYYYNVEEWLTGDAKTPNPPESRQDGRNSDWRHLVNEEIISMPDKWEYPWYAAWDLAFHCIPLALVDPDFAKKQLSLVLGARYMHPNGQIPAYEWKLEDVNPPVHAWGVRRVYQMEQKRNKGIGDLVFLEGAYHKLLINFTWWVNQKDKEGNGIFEGGFLGLDNIGVFDRSSKDDLPEGSSLSQADGTAWMAFYSLQMMQIAIELALHNPVYEQSAMKFFDHFLSIAYAMSNMGKKGYSLWDDEDGFFYDVLNLENGENIPLKLRSLVGIIPLFAAETIDKETLVKLPELHKHILWYLKENPKQAELVNEIDVPGQGQRRLLSLVKKDRLERILARVCDPKEFLSDYGVRGMSKEYDEKPYCFSLDPNNSCERMVRYRSGESDSGMFGGNSNWRGPVWFPVNYLLYESLQRYAHYYSSDFKINYPTGSDQQFSLKEIADDLARRLVALFEIGEDSRRPVYEKDSLFTKKGFSEPILFYEYFDGDNGRGLGASHQTGWTGLVAKLIQSIHAPLD